MSEIQQEPLSLYHRIITNDDIIRLIGNDVSNDWWLYMIYACSLGLPYILYREAGMPFLGMIGMYLILIIFGVCFYMHITKKKHVANRTSWAEKHFQESKWMIVSTSGFAESVDKEPVEYSVRIDLTPYTKSSVPYSQQVTKEEYDALCAKIPYPEGPFWLVLQYPTKSFGIKNKNYLVLDPFTTSNYSSIPYPADVEDWIEKHKY